MARKINKIMKITMGRKKKELITAEYNKLEESNVDIKKVREFAKARMEIDQLNARVSYLESLTKKSSELAEHVWKTLEGEVIPIQDLTDDHLKNIINYLQENGRGISVNLQIEYRKRFKEEIKFKKPREEGARIVDNPYGVTTRYLDAYTSSPFTSDNL